MQTQPPDRATLIAQLQTVPILRGLDETSLAHLCARHRDLFGRRPRAGALLYTDRMGQGGEKFA